MGPAPGRAGQRQAEASPADTGPVGWTVHLAVLAAYTLLTAVMTWPLAPNLTTAIPGDSFDGWQNFWNQWWIKVALVDNLRSPLFTDLLYAPTGVGLYFHTLNPFNGLTTLPVQLSAGLIPAYNAVVLISWVLGGYGAFLLARYVLVRPARHTPRTTHHAILPPFLAGVIFTFSPFHMAHLLGHMQVMSLQWIPFYILALMQATDRVRQGRSWGRQAMMAGLFLTLVGLCDWYFVLYLFLFTGLYLGIGDPGSGTRDHSAQRTRSRIPDPGSLLPDPRSLLPASVAGLIFLVLLSPLLIPMIREASQFSFMVRPSSDLYILSASVMDFLVPNRLHALFRPESFAWIGNQIAPVSERTISIGYTALLLAGIGLWKAPRRAGFWLISGGFFLLLALGPAINLGNITAESIPTGDVGSSWTPYGILNQTIPFMRISRSVSRFAVMVQLSMAVAAAVGLAGIGQRIARSSRRPLTRFNGLGLFAIAVVLAESWVAPFPMSPPDTPTVYAQIAQAPEEKALLNLPMNYDRPGYLLYQTVHGKPLTVAYISRDDPRTLTERVPILQHFRHLGPDIIQVDEAALGQLGRTVLADLDVGWVVLDRYKMPGGLERDYTDALAGAIFAGQPPLFEDERVTAFAVPPVETPAAYVALGPLHWGPLSDEGDAPAARPLLDGPARLDLHHVPAGASLRVTYRSPTQIGLSASSTGTVDGAQALPPLPGSGDLSTHTVAIPAGATSLFFQKSQGTGPTGSALIHRIELVLPVAQSF